MAPATRDRWRKLKNMHSQNEMLKNLEKEYKYMRSKQRPSSASTPRSTISTRSSSGTVSSRSSRSTSSRSSTRKINENKYFSLLKKTDVLGHLAQKNDDMMGLESELEWSKTQNLQLDAVYTKIMTQHQQLQQKYDQLEKIFLNHLVDMTRLQLEQESMRLGHSEDTAAEFAA